MKKIITLLTILLLVVFMVGCENSVNPTISDMPNSAIAKSDGEQISLAKKDKCTTIQSGDLVASDGSTIEVGFDSWGYNYQAHLFNGMYCDSYRDAAWCQEYKDVKLSMKWNDAWLSNKDCDEDGLLDRHNGFDSYIGSGAWITNHQSGEYDDGCKWNYFVKIVAVPEDAYRHWIVNGDWVLDFAGGTDNREFRNLVQDAEGNVTGEFWYLGQYGGTLVGTVNGDELYLYYERPAPLTYTGEFYGVIGENVITDGTFTDSNGNDLTWTATGTSTIGSIWYNGDGVEIGPIIWGQFAIIQQVENDGCAGLHGLQYISPARAGLGNW